MRVSRLKPLMVVVCWTPSVFARMSSIRRVTSVVRWKRRGVRQLHVQEQVALVLVGDEAGGQPPPEQAGRQHAKAASSARLTAVLRTRPCERPT